MENQNEVLIGDNYLSINFATMKRILTEWVNVNISGGPYSVNEIEDDSGDFKLLIKQLPTPVKTAT